MRNEFARAMIELAASRSDLVFLTADLGYMALEGVQQAYGDRFINAGVAEQNAISVAAGLARSGQLPWVYSMATFVTLRPYAQIRDNVCLQRLPVKLVGNGGGYGYGIMGATHHALEDVGLMRLLPHLRVYVPAFEQDVSQVVPLMASDPNPNYLRLNRATDAMCPVPPFAPFRKLKEGRSAVVITMGPIVESLFQMERADLLDELEIWSVGIFPLHDLPTDLVASIHHKKSVVTLEEHLASGGLGEALSHRLLTTGIATRKFVSLHAAGYPSGRYGSQNWHQHESGLAGPSLIERLEEALRA